MFPFRAARMNNMTTAELQQRLAAGENIKVIDVREDWEFEEGHIKGSLLRPLGYIRQWAAEFPKDQELVLICRTGARSGVAYQNLSAQGFTNLKNVSGGMVTWRGEVKRGLE